MRGNFSFHALFVTTHNAPLPNAEKLWVTCYPHEHLNDDIDKGDKYRQGDKCKGYAPLCKYQRPLLEYTIFNTRDDPNSDIGMCTYCLCRYICMLASG